MQCINLQLYVVLKLKVHHSCMHWTFTCRRTGRIMCPSTWELHHGCSSPLSWLHCETLQKGWRKSSSTNLQHRCLGTVCFCKFSKLQFDKYSIITGIFGLASYCGPLNEKHFEYCKRCILNEVTVWCFQWVYSQWILQLHALKANLTRVTSVLVQSSEKGQKVRNQCLVKYSFYIAFKIMN